MKPINIIRKLNESSQFESKRVPENEIEEKGYQYFSTHGVGPSTLPSDVNVKELDIKLPNGWVTFKTDRPLSDDEIKYYGIQPETKNSELKKKFKLDESDNYNTYSVVVGWNGLIGVENEYNIGARSRGDAVYHAIDEPGAEAEQDLSVEDITDNGDGSYEVTVNWCGFIGADETYTVNAEDESEAEMNALEEAKAGLEVISVDGTEFSYDEE